MTTMAPKKKTFPWKLHAMLDMADQKGFREIVSWLPDGKGFKVHDPAAFVEKIMPTFFHQSKYKSFQRQLNLWSFERLSAGPDKGGYSHPNFFIRDKRCKIYNMQRQKIKGILSTKIKRKVERIKKKVERIADAANTNTTSIEKRGKESSDVASVISQGSSTDNNSDASSIKSGSDGENCVVSPPTFLTTPISGNKISSLPAFEIEAKDCPQTGDCMDFEGRTYYFIDEEEIENTSNTICNTTLLRNPPPRLPVGGFPLPSLAPMLRMIPSHTYLSTANMMSEISRRRVTVEVFTDIRRQVKNIV